ncbi:MAG: GNAT family N-acetyltransferase [Chloroflexota bacterium]|nr:GNAT family N-acetyltransferase [Chloroflexota bacterium]
MIIKRALIADAKEILALQKLSYQSEAAIYNDYTIEPLTQSIEQMRIDIETKIVLKALIRDRPVGSVRAYAEQNTCYIGKLIVHPDFQGRGIGKSLIREIESIFSDTQRFELFTGHRSKRNIHLYQQLGFTVFRTEPLTEELTLLYLEKHAHSC